MCGPKTPKDTSGEEARQRERERESRIRQGEAAINRTLDGAFSPEFFASAAQDTRDVLTPDLNKQFDDANRQTTFGLARQGILESRDAGKRFAELLDLNNRALIDVDNRAADTVSSLRSDVANTRQNLLAQNSIAADPSSARANATAAATGIAAPRTITPLGNVFSSALESVTNALLIRSALPTQQRPQGANLVNRNEQGSRIIGG